MNNLFLDDIDLLEAVDMSILLQEEVINEATIASMKVTKEKLEDEDYVKELVKKIKENKHDLRNNTIKTMFIVGVISTLTIVGAPIGILLMVIASNIKSGNEINQKDLEKLDDCFEKTIDKLKNKLNKTKDESKRKELSRVIEQLEENRERIYERKAKAEIDERLKKVVDFSKYGDHGIKVGKSEIICVFTDGEEDPVKYANTFNSEKEIQDKFKTNKFPFDKIEQFYANGIKIEADLIKLINSKGKPGNGFQLMGNSDDSYGPTVTKYLKDKQVEVILTDVHDTCIIYSLDDKCCYDWVGEETDVITKISVNDFLKASKTAYEDLVKIYKEFKK